MCVIDQRSIEAEKKIALKLTNILEWLSSLSFLDKQRDIYAKRQPDTGQWLFNKI